MRYIINIILILVLWSILVNAGTPDVIGNNSGSSLTYPLFRAFDLGELEGWPKTMDISGVGPGGGPKAYDLNTDGSSEIILGSTDGMLYVWEFDGSDFPGFPVDVGSPIRSAAAIGNINATPECEIIVTTTTGALAAYDNTGSIVTGFPRRLASGFTFNSPALWDFDGDGILEIIASDDSLYVIRGDGSNYPGFPVKVNSLYGTVASPAVGDVDNDQVPEIVVEGWDSLFLFDGYGIMEEGWPVGLEEDYDGFSYSAPVLVDFDRNDSLEIIAGYHESGGGAWQGKVAVWTCTGEYYSDWYPIAFYDYGSWTYSTAAVGDIDNDGNPEYAMTSHNGDISMRYGDGTSPEPWPLVSGYSNLECSAVMGDVDSDGNLDVIIGTNGADYLMLGYKADESPLDSFPLTASAAITVNSPIIGDFNGDGSIELVSTAIDGIVHMWRLLGNYSPGLLPWTQIHHDPWNTGWYHPLPPDSITLDAEESIAHLTWNPVNDRDFVGFNIYKTHDSTGIEWELLTPESIEDPFFTDTAFTTDTSVYYFITGVIESGLEGPRSMVVGLIDTTSIHNKTQKPGSFTISAYPNPFNAEVSLEISIMEPAEINLRIINLMGKEIESWNYILAENTKLVKKWQPEGLSGGIYFWKTTIKEAGSIVVRIGKLVYLP